MKGLPIQAEHATAMGAASAWLLIAFLGWPDIYEIAAAPFTLGGAAIGAFGWMFLFRSERNWRVGAILGVAFGGIIWLIVH